MFDKVRIFVCFSSGLGTWRYSHDLHAKKKAAMMSWWVARWSSVVLSCAMRDMTESGIAFCWIFLGLVSV
jgi:hypothetical protein